MTGTLGLQLCWSHLLWLISQAKNVSCQFNARWFTGGCFNCHTSSALLKTMYANCNFVHRANCLAYNHTSALECQTIVVITWLRPLSSVQSASRTLALYPGRSKKKEQPGYEATWTLVSQSYCLIFSATTQRWCCSSSVAKVMNGKDHVLCD